MHKEMESVFYYITTMNENYQQPEMPKGVEQDIISGMYLLEDGNLKSFKVAKPVNKDERLRLLGSGTILREALKAAAILRSEYSVAVDVWSVTSFNELRKEALAISRENMFNPSKKPKVPFITEKLSARRGPVVAATDYMKTYSDQVREFVPDTYRVLGTDGFGRSDTREQLRHFFEVDSKFIVLAALSELNASGLMDDDTLTKYLKKAGIDKDKINPLHH
jgi:pyruvate dehydrogenase E1 component